MSICPCSHLSPPMAAGKPIAHRRSRTRPPTNERLRSNRYPRSSHITSLANRPTVSGRSSTFASCLRQERGIGLLAVPARVLHEGSNLEPKFSGGLGPGNASERVVVPATKICRLFSDGTGFVHTIHFIEGVAVAAFDHELALDFVELLAAEDAFGVFFLLLAIDHHGDIHLDLGGSVAGEADDEVHS